MTTRVPTRLPTIVPSVTLNPTIYVKSDDQSNESFPIAIIILSFVILILFIGFAYLQGKDNQEPLKVGDKVYIKECVSEVPKFATGVVDHFDLQREKFLIHCHETSRSLYLDGDEIQRTPLEATDLEKGASIKPRRRQSWMDLGKKPKHVQISPRKKKEEHSWKGLSIDYDDDETKDENRTQGRGGGKTHENGTSTTSAPVKRQLWIGMSRASLHKMVEGDQTPLIGPDGKPKKRPSLLGGLLNIHHPGSHHEGESGHEEVICLDDEGDDIIDQLDHRDRERMGRRHSGSRSKHRHSHYENDVSRSERFQSDGWKEHRRARSEPRTMPSKPNPDYAYKRVNVPRPHTKQPPERTISLTNSLNSTALALDTMVDRTFLGSSLDGNNNDSSQPGRGKYFVKPSEKSQLLISQYKQEEIEAAMKRDALKAEINRLDAAVRRKKKPQPRRSDERRYQTMDDNLQRRGSSQPRRSITLDSVKNQQNKTVRPPMERDSSVDSLGSQFAARFLTIASPV